MSLLKRLQRFLFPRKQKEKRKRDDGTYVTVADVVVSYSIGNMRVAIREEGLIPFFDSRVRQYLGDNLVSTDMAEYDGRRARITYTLRDFDAINLQALHKWYEAANRAVGDGSVEIVYINLHAIKYSEYLPLETWTR